MFPTLSVLLLAALPPPALLLSAPLAVTLSGPNGAFTLEAPGPAEAQERVRRSLRRLTGVNPHSLRYTPILRERIVRSLERGHDVPDMLRSLVLPGIVMEDFPPSPPCVRFRSRGCLAVHLDGVPVPATFVRDLPLEAVEAVLVVGDKEMIQYPGGAVLLYTAGWLGANR